LLVLIPNDETPYQYRKLTPFQLLTNQRFLQQQTTPQFREVIDAIGAKNLNALLEPDTAQKSKTRDDAVTERSRRYSEK